MSSPTHAMLLAAGLGTRLGSLSEQRPKPMLPVCNRPLVSWCLTLFHRHGLTDAIINLHHLGGQIQQHFAVAVGEGNLTFSPEPEILGTGGGIRRMAGLLPRGTCVVMNAKIVTDVDLGQVLEAHHASGAVATLVVRPHPEAERWGAVAVEPDGRVGRILQRSRPGAGGAVPHMFTGIHVLSPGLIECIPEGKSCIVRDTYMPLLGQGRQLHAYVHEGYFYDHSTPARYLQGNLNLVNRGVAPAAAPGPLQGVDPSAEIAASARLVHPVLIGPRARVEPGAVVGPGVVLGDGARVGSGVEIREAVVWDGVGVSRSGARLVATPKGIVEIPDDGDPEARPR